MKGEITVPESELYHVYSLLADATEAAATGDPNGCASLTAEAKEEIKRIYSEYYEE